MSDIDEIRTHSEYIQKIEALEAELAAAQERIAALETAQDWEPVPDETWIDDAHSDGVQLYYADGLLTLTAPGKVRTTTITIRLPDTVRLWRSPQEQLPE